jgi:hypothetical protein
MIYKQFTIGTSFKTVERVEIIEGGKVKGAFLRRVKTHYLINPTTGIKRMVKSQHAAKWRVGRAQNLATLARGLV